MKEVLSRPPVKVDYAIGFGIGMRGDGKPSLLSMAVAGRCAGLVSNNLAHTIIFTGGSQETVSPRPRQ